MTKYLAVAVTTFLLSYSALSVAMTDADSQAFLKDFPSVFAKGACKKLLPSLLPATCECIGAKVALHMGEKKGLQGCTAENMDACMEKVEGDALADVTQKDIEACTTTVVSADGSAPVTAPAAESSAVKTESGTADQTKSDSTSEN
jgi:hypothetical protein